MHKPIAASDHAEELDPLDVDLNDIIRRLRWCRNEEVAAAIRGYLIAATQLLPLRSDRDLTEADGRYVLCALGWAGKARAATEALLSEGAR